ncbi:MAG: helix-turn-helix domain containing protein [Campylobacter sp.]|nr:helix-turn-helix domain containing protein [Campylobacter sp.]
MDVTETLNKLKQAYNVDTMRELSKIMGVSITTFNTWRNRKNIPKKYLLECSRLTKCSYEWLLGDNEKKMASQNIIGDHNIQINGKNNNITTLNTAQNQQYAELFELIKNYATPKMLIDLKNKLLKIKELYEN